MQHGRTGLIGALAIAWSLVLASPALAHPEAGGHAAGIPTPPHRLGVPPALRRLLPHTSTPAGADYPGALWEPASPANYTVADRPLFPQVKRIVIHVAEGGFEGTYRWFRNPAAQASAHFVVGSQGQVAQMVHLRDIAWHAGNWAYNETSVGIEHAGFTNRTWFPYAEYRASARLAGWVARRFLITPDRDHVIGHNEVPDPFHPGQFGGADHHTDPGHTWEWSRYMAFLRAAAHDTYQQVVDNSDSTRVRYDHARWIVSSARPSHQGPDYLVAHPGAGKPVSYRLKIPADDRYDLFIRYPCNAGYNRHVTVGVATAGGYQSVVVDESRNCTHVWNRLGNFALTAGDAYKLVVLASSPDSGNIAADAVKVVEQSDLTPPTAPTLSLSTTATTLAARWTKPTDNIGVGGYQLWVDSQLAYLGGERSVTVDGLHCGRSYEVSLRALDLVSNRSPRQPQTATTPACPTQPANVRVTGQTASTITLRWDAGGPTVVGFDVYRNGKRVTRVTGQTYTFTGLDCTKPPYVLGVDAYDAAGERSAITTVTSPTAPC